MNDKILHFVFGVAIAAFFSPFGIVVSILLTALIGALKEYWDSRGNGQVEAYDFAATAGGGIALFGWWEFIKWIPLV